MQYLQYLYNNMQYLQYLYNNMQLTKAHIMLLIQFLTMAIFSEFYLCLKSFKCRNMII